MTESSQQKQSSFGWLKLLGIIALVVFLLFHLYWPISDLFERHTQRQQISERVKSAGGWTVLKQDCVALANANASGFSWWSLGRETNSLPPAIAALHPRRVLFYTHQNYPNGTWWSSANHSDAAVRIFIFGTHSTDGHDQPSLGLDVLCETGVTDYIPPDNWRSDIPLRYWKYRKITDDVYEFY